MAAPLVAGCAALVREYYVTSRAHAEPSAALLKATLINGTRKLPGADAVADFDVVPNMHQGFGLIQMPNAYPNPINPQLKLEFLDDWKTPAGLFSMTGQRKRYEIDVAAGMRLSICLTWTDPPGRALQNNLNLLVELPGGGKMTGNHGLPLSLGPIDQENNVEVDSHRSARRGQVLDPDLRQQHVDRRPGLRAGRHRSARERARTQMRPTHVQDSRVASGVRRQPDPGVRHHRKPPLRPDRRWT